MYDDYYSDEQGYFNDIARSDVANLFTVEQWREYQRAVVDRLESIAATGKQIDVEMTRMDEVIADIEKAVLAIDPNYPPEHLQSIMNKFKSLIVRGIKTRANLDPDKPGFDYYSGSGDDLLDLPDPFEEFNETE